jgi:hypothetical protein
MFAFVGLYLILLKKSYAKLLFLFFPVFYFIVIGAGRVRWERWFVAVHPFEAILFGVGFYSTYRFFVQADEFRAYKSRIILLFVILMTVGSLSVLKRDIKEALLISELDNRSVAKEWVEANLPRGAKIAYEPTTAHLHIKPRDNLKLIYVPEGITSYPLSHYCRSSVGYLMITESRKSRLADFPKIYAKQLYGYRELENKAELIKSIHRKGYPGPVIQIFKLDNCETGPKVKSKSK